MIEKILIVDDSATARMIIKRCLNIAGFNNAEYLEAKDGYQAIEMAKSNSIDLMVTDLIMPNMDGCSLLKRVKSSPRLTDLPVLVITSNNNPRKEMELQELGAFAVLSKPVSPANLADTLNTINQDSSWG